MIKSKLSKPLATMSGTLLFLTLVVVGVSVKRVAAFDCVPDSSWCFWPPYPATPLWGSAAGQCDTTDCELFNRRRCYANSPYAFFGDCEEYCRPGGA